MPKSPLLPDLSTIQSEAALLDPATLAALAAEARDLAAAIAAEADRHARQVSYLVGEPTNCEMLIGASSDPVERAVGVRLFVEVLRNARAALAGSESHARQAERILVLSVCGAGEANFGGTWGTNAFDKETGRVELKIRNPRSVEDFADMTIEGIERLVSPVAYAALREPETRDKLIESIALRVGKASGRGRARGKAPRWIEPLFLVALRAGVVPGESLNPHGWYQTLLRRDILPKKARAK